MTTQPLKTAIFSLPNKKNSIFDTDVLLRRGRPPCISTRDYFTPEITTTSLPLEREQISPGALPLSIRFSAFGSGVDSTLAKGYAEFESFSHILTLANPLNAYLQSLRQSNKL